MIFEIFPKINIWFTQILFCCSIYPFFVGVMYRKFLGCQIFSFSKLLFSFGFLLLWDIVSIANVRKEFYVSQLCLRDDNQLTRKQMWREGLLTISLRLKVPCENLPWTVFQGCPFGQDFQILYPECIGSSMGNSESIASTQSGLSFSPVTREKKDHEVEMKCNPNK